MNDLLAENHERYLLQRDGMDVILTKESTVIKRAHTEENIKALRNHWQFLKALEGTGFAPKPIRLEGNELESEYIEKYINPDQTLFHEEYRHNCVRLIFELRNRGIRHGDLVHLNYVIRDTTPVVFDWDQSNFVFQNRPQNRPIMDSAHFYRQLYYQTGDINRVMRRWLSVREQIDEYRGWGKIVDLGTCFGDFAAIAQSELFLATGVDNCQMHSDCLDLAESRWGKYGCKFINSHIADMDCSEYDIALLFSTWTYIINDRGQEAALRVLKGIMEQVDVLFFETQLHGDSHGVEFLKDDADTHKMLSNYGIPELLVTIPVTGTNNMRTVWKVTK